MTKNEKPFYRHLMDTDTVDLFLDAVIRTVGQVEFVRIKGEYWDLCADEGVKDDEE